MTKSIYLNDSNEADVKAWNAAELAAKKLRVSVSRIVLDALRAYFNIPPEEGFEISEEELADSETARLVDDFLRRKRDGEKEKTPMPQVRQTLPHDKSQEDLP